MSEAQSIGTQSLAVKAALAGGQVAQSSWVAPWEPWCDNPVRIDRRVTSRQARGALTIGKCKMVDMLKSLEVSAHVPCRRCEKCLKFRQCRWRARAVVECERANRTWWMSLSFSPIHLAGILAEARSGEVKDIERAAYRHVQKYFKRLRKGNKLIIEDGVVKRRFNAPADFRYFAVYERGDLNGRSHYHLLLHETGSRPIPNATIQDHWPSFVWVRLLSGEDVGRTASYITKYATKSLDIRPRASVLYGKTSVTLKPLGLRGTISLIGGKTDDAPSEKTLEGSCFEKQNVSDRRKAIVAPPDTIGNTIVPDLSSRGATLQKGNVKCL